MDFGRNDYNAIFKDVESQIPEDEPVFLFRATDPLVPRILLNYATEMRLTGTDPKVADSVVAHAQKIMDWQKVHGTKHADLIHESEDRIREKARIRELIEGLEIDGHLTDVFLSELSDLVDSVYGQGRCRLVMPNEEYLNGSNESESRYELVIKIHSKSDMEVVWMSDKI